MRASIVELLCILVKIVLKPVAIVSALSRVVALTLVNTAINSLRASLPSLTPLLAAAKTPPVLEIAAIISPASTAKAAATAFILPRASSSSLADIPNCLIKAILPSTVLFKLSKDGARLVRANARTACSASLAANPAWARVTLREAKSLALTPKLVDKLVIVLDMPSSCALVLPVT